MKHQIVKASELGTNCWRAVRFTGGECSRVLTCDYPEKEKCHAYQEVRKRVTIKTKVHANGKIEIDP